MTLLPSVDDLASRFWQAPSEAVFEEIQKCSAKDTKNLRPIVLHYNAAMHLGRIGQAELAVIYLKDRFPHNPLSKTWPIELDLRKGQFQEALENFLKLDLAQKRNPDFIHKWVTGCIRGKFGQGLESVAVHIENLPDSVQKFHAAAVRAHFLNKTEEATTHYYRILDLAPNNVEAWLKLAEIALAKNAPREAYAILRSALQQNPDLMPVRSKLLALTIQDDPEHVDKASLEHFVQKATDRVNALKLALIWARRQQNKTYEDELLSRLTTAAPEIAKIEEAETALSRGFPRDTLTLTAQIPNTPTLRNRYYELRAKALRVLGDEAALHRMIEDLSKEGASPDQLCLAAEVAIWADDLTTAIRLAQMARISDPLLQRAWNLETLAMTRNGMGQKALELLKTVPDTLSHSDVILERRFQAARAVGNFTVACRALKAAATTSRGKYLYLDFLTYLGSIGVAQQILNDWHPKSLQDKAWKHCAAGRLSLTQFDLDDAIAQFNKAIRYNSQLPKAFFDRAFVHLFRFDPKLAMQDANRENQLNRIHGAKPRRLRDGFLGQLANELLLDPYLTEEARLAMASDNSATELLKLFSSHSGNTMLAIGVLIAMRQRNLLTKQFEISHNPDAITHIPKKIFQYWEDTTPPSDVATAMTHLAQANPWAEYKRFDRKSAHAYVREHGSPEMGQAFKISRHAAERADLLRLVVLGQEGGIWIDADDICHGDLTKLLPQEAKLVLYQEWLGSTGNNFIAAIPNHPILRQVTEYATTDMLSGTSEFIWLRTGPGALTRAVVNAIVQTGKTRLPEDICILQESELLQQLATACPFSYKQTASNWIRNRL